MPKRLGLWVGGVLWGVAVATPGWAGALVASSDHHDVLPLSIVLDRVMPAIEGEIERSVLVKTKDHWVYAITYYDENGAQKVLHVDAQTGIIVSAENTPR